MPGAGSPALRCPSHRPKQGEAPVRQDRTLGPHITPITMFVKAKRKTHLLRARQGVPSPRRASSNHITGSSQQPCEVGVRAHPRCRCPQLGRPPKSQGSGGWAGVEPTRRAIGSVTSIGQRVGGYRRGGRGGHAPPPRAVQGLWVQPVPWECAQGVPVAVEAERDTGADEGHLLPVSLADKCYADRRPAARTGEGTCSARERHLEPGPHGKSPWLPATLGGGGGHPATSSRLST